MNSEINDRIIDWQVIMDSCGDESIAEQVVAVSVKDAQEATDFLSAAISAGSCADVRLYAHRLKGVAMTIGARRLSEAAYCLERAGAENDIQTVREFFGGLKAEFAKVRDFLSADNWMGRAKQCC